MLQVRHSSSRPQKFLKTQTRLLPKALKVRVGFLLGRSGSLIREMFNEALSEIGIECKHFGIISVLSEHKGLAQHEISQYLLIDRTTMAALIKDLVGKKLIESRVSSVDARAHVLTLTKKGRQIFKKGTEIAIQIEKSFLASLTKVEWASLHCILEKLVFTGLNKIRVIEQ